MPSYVGGFQCIGGKCEDSCCIGWDIDVDKRTLRRYSRVEEPSLVEKFEEHVYLNPDYYSAQVDYGKIAIRESRWCPFLEEDRLCAIQRNLGEDFLSNVCYSFPRAYNILDGIYEMSLYMSCPEAVRKLFSSREPITFVESDMPDVRHIVNSSIKTKGFLRRKRPLDRLPELRRSTIGILQDRSVSLKERILRIGDLLNVPRGIVSGEKYSLRIGFYRYGIELLGQIEELDSPLFARYTAFVMEDFREEDPGYYGTVAETILLPFIQEYSWALEHFLVNGVFQENFPMGDGGDEIDSYIMLSIRYGLLQFYLVGLSGREGKLNLDDLAGMIQVHSKIINHHKSFLFNLLQEIKRKEYGNRDFVSLILD